MSRRLHPGCGATWRSRRELPGREALPTFGQRRVVAITLGDDGVRGRPRDGETGIVPRDATLGIRVVVAADLVDEVGHLAEHAEPMRESDRHVQLPMARVVELERLPLTEGR